MRTRHPFPDVQERERPIATVLPPGQYALLAAELEKRTVVMPLNPPVPRPHSGENRRQRRAAVATFEAPEGMAPNLRRVLLEKRQAKALGTLDPALRRLQRKALKNG